MVLPAPDPPYRGLARFEPDDHARFFGRTRLAESLTALTRASRCVIVLGPSGSGTSSLLRAGLIPLLRNTEVAASRPAAIRICTPGPRPMRDRRKLFIPAEGPGDTWLVIDQSEEVFTLCKDLQERREFIGLLLAPRDRESRLRVVLGVRADFYGRLLEHQDLAPVLAEAALPVGPMSADELRRVGLESSGGETRYSYAEPALSRTTRASQHGTVLHHLRSRSRRRHSGLRPNSVERRRRQSRCTSDVLGCATTGPHSCRNPQLSHTDPMARNWQLVATWDASFCGTDRSSSGSEHSPEPMGPADREAPRRCPRWLTPPMGRYWQSGERRGRFSCGTLPPASPSVCPLPRRVPRSSP